MMMKQVVRAAVCVCVLGGLLAGPAVAKRITGERSDFLPGVDSDGNKDFGNGGDAISKLIKYTGSGIIINRATGKVTNDSGRRFVERGFACNVADPEDESLVFSIPATRTRQVVSRQKGEGRATNRALCVFNPNKVEVSVAN